ncbi:transmembrane protein 272-like isoform X2 [Ptychodera flava]|uniref:transmembrane protein 272-like isoform X2 n=1 Tax=Ptychodera flava TaxID=63121 RepID=UPI00396A6DC7
MDNPTMKMSQLPGQPMDEESAIPTSGIDGPPTYGTPPPLYQPDANAPPSYEDANRDAPPSYQSLFGQMQEAKRSSTGATDFFKKFLAVVLGTLGCTIGIGIIMAIPIAMIVMGSLYLHDCPIEPYIPIYLIVGGCFGVLKNLVSLGQRVKRHNEEGGEQEDNVKSDPFNSLLNCFLLAWFIAGNVWIYRSYEPDYEDKSSDSYCSEPLYKFAFWLTNATYIMLVLCCCCLCCAAGCTAVKTK